MTVQILRNGQCNRVAAVFGNGCIAILVKRIRVDDHRFTRGIISGAARFTADTAAGIGRARFCRISAVSDSAVTARRCSRQMLSGTACNVHAVLIVTADFYGAVIFIDGFLVPIQRILKNQQIVFNLDTVFGIQERGKVNTVPFDFGISRIFYICLKTDFAVKIALDRHCFAVETELGFQIKLSRHFRVDGRALIPDFKNHALRLFCTEESNLVADGDADFHVAFLYHRDRTADIKFNNDIKTAHARNAVAAYRNLKQSFLRLTSKFSRNFRIGVKPDRSRCFGHTE